jgi:hypothetical protein
VQTLAEVSIFGFGIVSLRLGDTRLNRLAKAKLEIQGGVLELIRNAAPYILTAAIIVLGFIIIYLIVAPPGAFVSTT